MKHFEEQLETEVFEANLELRNLRDESQKDDLMANRDTAQAIDASHQLQRTNPVRASVCYLRQHRRA
ncbi:hypothetical protein BASA50_002523 [Batrachochytrium salamandrivorans]|uniref:Uncharacterized protein n=1 Tax=Batrachochytrium salamandrivorans TaxID=1357716 RepID=A0ABQ8FL03_9FUNG|nr:hypothetical protein BASA50_002523 [Batrachochytrium salamandrivorans]